jgi:hypothetical protein
MIPKMDILRSIKKNSKKHNVRKIPLIQIQNDILLADKPFSDLLLQLEKNKLIKVEPKEWYQDFDAKRDSLFIELTEKGEKKLIG